MRRTCVWGLGFLSFVLSVITGCGGSGAVLQESASPDGQTVGGSKVVETEAVKGVSFSEIVPESLQKEFLVLDVPPLEAFSLDMEDISFTSEDLLRFVNIQALTFHPSKANAEVISGTDTIKYPGFRGTFQLTDPHACGFISVGQHDVLVCPGSIKVLPKEGTAVVNGQAMVVKPDSTFVKDLQEALEKITEEFNRKFAKVPEGQTPSDERIQARIEQSVENYLIDTLFGG